MRIWFLVKLLAFFVVIGVMGFTAMLAYHVVVRPLGGVFEKMIPNPTEVIKQQPDVDFAKMLDSAELPDIDPGEKAFQKAHELIALGKLPEAREKLTAIVNVFPTSPSAPIARRIVGDMNLDDIFSPSFKEGKQTHIVKRGDSYLAIAGKYKTTLDCILYLNGMLEFANIQPGDEIVVMPLEFRLLIEPARKTISIWDKGRFIREYPILHLETGAKLVNLRTSIESKSAIVDSKRIQPQAKGYRGAEKIIQVAKLPLPIAAEKPGEVEHPRGIFLSGPDIEELSLLTRAGNEVEIRMPAK